MLPRLACPRRKPAPVRADIHTAEWKNIEPIFLRENVSGQEPSRSTWFKVAWDDIALRVLFHAEDADAWATLRANDLPLYEEEVVEVFIDPAGKLETYFEFEVNPLNFVCDLVLQRVGDRWDTDFGWHCDGLQTAAIKSKTSWAAEMAIPFASLGGLTTPAPGDVWRANFYRIERPKNAGCELSAWSPTGQPRFHVQERFGHLEFKA